MARNNSLSDSKNPFFMLEDDVDDETFLRNSAPRSNPYSQHPYVNYDNELEQTHQKLMERRQQIEERTINSSERSISLLRDSEQIGAATAEELIRQREQLERTEKRLDDINTTLRFSQKHIQGIKSVFGSLKNYLSGKSVDATSSTVMPAKMTESLSSGSVATPALYNSLEQVQSQRAANHPALKSKGLFDEDDGETVTKNVSAVLEKNLDEMSGSLARLKGLAIGLSEEIDSQNDLIDNITDKTETADITLQKQNKDMNLILKK